MSSEATERQGADDNALEDEPHAEESGEGPSGDEERLEARAATPTRVEEDEEERADTGDEDEDDLVDPSSETPDETSEAGTADASAEIEADTDGETDGSEETSAETLIEEDSEAEAEELENLLDLPEFDHLEEQASEWLDGLFERMNVDAEGDFFWEGDEPRVDIRGPDAERLLGLGKLGPKAIEGVETLLQSVFSEDDAASDVYVDVDGKREDRKAMLEDVAVQMADKAVDLDDKFTVSGLNSTERRIIHRRLRDYDGVDTESVGDGIFRRLTIEPTRD